jgi:hypothetical protein
MSIESLDLQATVDEVPLAPSPPLTLQRLTEVPPPEDALLPPPGLPPPPGLSSASGLPQPVDVNEIAPEMMELLDNVSLELTRIADAFPTSAFMTKDKDFESEYFTTFLPPGLFDDVSTKPTGDSEDESDLRIDSKLDSNESSDESTRAWSKSSNLDEASNLEDPASRSRTESLVSDEDEGECEDEVPELPDLSAKNLSAKKLKVANASHATRSTTRIVFGEEGAALAAEAAQLAKANTGAMTWVSPPYAHAMAYWNPYYSVAPGAW